MGSMRKGYFLTAGLLCCLLPVIETAKLIKKFKPHSLRARNNTFPIRNPAYESCVLDETRAVITRLEWQPPDGPTGPLTVESYQIQCKPWTMNPFNCSQSYNVTAPWVDVTTTGFYQHYTCTVRAHGNGTYGRLARVMFYTPLPKLKDQPIVEFGSNEMVVRWHSVIAARYTIELSDPSTSRKFTTKVSPCYGKGLVEFPISPLPTFTAVPFAMQIMSQCILGRSTQYEHGYLSSWFIVTKVSSQPRQVTVAMTADPRSPCPLNDQFVSNVRLTWSAPSGVGWTDIKHYKVGCERRSKNFTDPTISSNVTNGGFNFSYVGLDPFTCHISAYNGTDYGESSVITSEPALPIVNRLNLQWLSPSQMTLGWKSNVKASFLVTLVTMDRKGSDNYEMPCSTKWTTLNITNTSLFANKGVIVRLFIQLYFDGVLKPAKVSMLKLYTFPSSPRNFTSFESLSNSSQRILDLSWVRPTLLGGVNILAIIYDVKCIFATDGKDVVRSTNSSDTETQIQFPGPESSLGNCSVSAYNGYHYGRTVYLTLAASHLPPVKPAIHNKNSDSSGSTRMITVAVVTVVCVGIVLAGVVLFVYWRRKRALTYFREGDTALLPTETDAPPDFTEDNPF